LSLLHLGKSAFCRYVKYQVNGAGLAFVNNMVLFYITGTVVIANKVTVALGKFKHMVRKKTGPHSEAGLFFHFGFLFVHVSEQI
jgi:hypothetical protein